MRKVQRKPLTPMRFGVQDQGAAERGDFHGLDAGRAMGAHSVRFIVGAREIRRAPGNYDFSGYDHMVNEARSRGLRPQLVLDTAKGFTHGGDPKEFARFAAAAAQHFKGRVSRYSLINEPNERMSPKMYRALYQRGRRAVKRHDLGAQVLFGELSPNRDPMDYARRVIGKGGVRAEGFALHPYQNTDPLAPQQGNLGGMGRLGALQKELAHTSLRTGKGKMPGLYLTEFGYATKGKYGVSPEQAAAWWPRAVQKARSAGVRQLVAYHMSEETNPNASWDTSLLDAQGNPRPSYKMLAAAIRRR